MPGVPQELSMIIQWYLQKAIHGAPSNNHVDKIIEKVRGGEGRNSYLCQTLPNVS